jgi:hypothetical protein
MNKHPLLPCRISWSSLSCWEKSKKEFYKRYIIKEPMFETKELKFGKWFSQEIEKPKSENETIEMIRPIIGIYKYPEHMVKKELETPIGIVPIISFLDGYDPGIGEYKTGKTPWTQDRVNKHGQLDFYNFILGKPEDTTLYWIQTENDNYGNIKLTGKVEQFKRDISEKDISKLKDRIIKASVEIHEYYKTIIEDTFK